MEMIVKERKEERKEGRKCEGKCEKKNFIVKKNFFLL